MTTRPQRTVRVVGGPESLAREAAHRFIEIAGRQIDRRGRFTVALSGGSTPRALYQLLAQPPQAEAIDWRRVFVFFGDERTVPPDHRDSNYRMARESLLDHVPVPHDQIFRMQGENEPERAADEYEYALRQVFGLDEGDRPDFGLILLGIGPDGHTASLFPGTEALTETDRIAVANTVPQLGTTRLTLTVPVITEAANIMTLAAGPDKAEAIWRALEAPYDPDQTPAQIVRTAAGSVVWLLDQAAAGRLANGLG